MTEQSKPRPRVEMYCNKCGSTEGIAKDAWAEWDVDSQQWVIGSVFDHTYCHLCEESECCEEREIST